MTSLSFVPAPALTSSVRRTNRAKTDLLRNAARATRGSVHLASDQLRRSHTAQAGAAVRSLAWHCGDYLRRTGRSPRRFTIDPNGRIVISGSRRAYTGAAR